MKTMTVFEARNHFARTLEAAKEDVIIEDLLLERSERFWEMIARARRGKPIAIEDLRRRVEGRHVARKRGARPLKRPASR